ncbi:MAG: TonB-dependent receptor [Porphyromonadaceae bacterium]|nr:TonB-dependent receptor [Porphyromonadaceae bacterium]
MKKINLIVLLISFLSIGLAEQALAQKKSDANVIGHVVDQKTGEHLAGITIAVKGTTFGTATDATGHYALRHLRPGGITLVMQGLGYRSQELEVRVEAGKTVEVNFTATQDNIRLDEVVVSANRQTTLRRLAPTLVNVVDAKIFEQANANNLSQGLVFQPGVRVENNCQNCGFSQVRINGLDGRYSQILIDSRPVISSLAGIYGLEQIPTNMIERVEVVRGGGSALFGSSAIAGVVNVITKEPVGNSVTVNESFGMTGFRAPDNNLSFNASVVSDDSRAGAMLFGQARYRGEYDMNDDGYSEIGRLDARAIGVRAYVKPSDLTKLTGEVHTFYEDRRGGDNLDLPEFVTGIREATQHSLYSGNIKFDAFSRGYKHHFQAYASGQLVRRGSYYGGIGDPAAKDKDGKEIEIGGKNVPGRRIGYPVHPSDYGMNAGLTHGQTYVAGAQYTYDFAKLFFMPAQLLVGAEYTHDILTDVMPLRQWITKEWLDGGHGGVSLTPALHQTIGNASQFAQLEWKNKTWSFLLGARLDENSAVKNPILSPRATLRYNPNDQINLRATYAKGFRAPQVFDEDLHVGVVNGEAQRIENAPDLRPEISHAFSVSSDMYFRLGGSTQLNVLVEGFYTSLQDVFTNNKFKPANAVEGITYFRRSNYGIDDEGNRVSSGATVFGANLEAKLAYRWLQIQAGLTLTSNKYDANQEWGTRHLIKGLKEEGEYLNYAPAADGSSFVAEADEDGEAQTIGMTSKQIMRTPSLYGYFTIGLNPIKPLNIALTGTYTGRMWVPHAIKWGQGAAASDIAGIDAGLRKDGYQVALVDASGAPILEDGKQKMAEAQWDELTHTPAFFDLGMRFSYDFKLFSKTSLQLYAGVNNLFGAFQKDYDLGPDRDSAYIYGPTMPRSGYAGLRFTF